MASGGQATIVIPDLTKEKYDLIGAMLHGTVRQMVLIFALIDRSRRRQKNGPIAEGAMTVNKFEVLSKTESPPFPTEWYDFSSETHFWIRWRFEAFRMLLRDNGLLVEPGQRGLDVGCGTGIIQRQLQSGLGWHVDGCDLNSEALTRNWTPDARIMLYNVFDRTIALRETYDYLVMFDVLEHIQEPVPFLEAALHSLKPGGIVFINVPALPSLFSRYDVAAGHFRRYTRSALADELQRAGIEITETRYWGLSLVLI